MFTRYFWEVEFAFIFLSISRFFMFCPNCLRVDSSVPVLAAPLLPAHCPLGGGAGVRVRGW